MRWPIKTRKNVLLRCFFRCTWPGCLNLASDMHHVILRSEGGSDAHDNVIGFCQTCHRRAHNDKSLIYDDELNCWLEPLDMAKRWLARQIQQGPLRLD